MRRKRASTVPTPGASFPGPLEPVVHATQHSRLPCALPAPPKHDFAHQHPQHKLTCHVVPPRIPVHSGPPSSPGLWGQPSVSPQPFYLPLPASPGLGVCQFPIIPYQHPPMASSPSQQPHPFPEALLSPTDLCRVSGPRLPCQLLPPVPSYAGSMVSLTREGRPMICQSPSWAPVPPAQVPSAMSLVPLLPLLPRPTDR